MNASHALSTHARLAATVAAFALVAAACGGDVSGGEPTAADLVHTHGLQQVPGDDALYVATHTGLYTVDDGTIKAVGTATHDLMGFTVAGPDDLLASGHPDLRDEKLSLAEKPPLLGLVHSKEGQEWQPLSLLGEVDFHSLVAAHDQVYGLDSQTGSLLVSADRQTWETRSEGLPFIDLAVSPDDPDRLVATTQTGIAGSDDGGESWTDLSTQRALFLDWTDDGLFAVSPEGAVARSDDGGQNWESLGRVDGSPQAVLVTANGIYVAVEAGIMQSTDGGETFEFLVRTSDDA